MLKLVFAVALGALAVSPAWAQKTNLPDRPQKQSKQFDTDAIKEGITTMKQSGECTVNFVVEWTGKAKDLAADCTVDGFALYAIRAVEGAEWEPEIIKGELLDSFPMRQTFRFGAIAANTVDPRGEKSPVLESGVQPGDISRAINKIDQEGVCEVKFTVGADGKPKDITPNCTPDAYNQLVIEAMAKMKFTPGQKGGAPTDWPGMSMPIKLTKPEKPKKPTDTRSSE
jgi:hypothetical protein